MLPYFFTNDSLYDVFFYAAQYEEKLLGLGGRFMDEVENTAIEISKMPKGYESRYKSTRERKVQNFPYKLIYTIEREAIYIHAVFASRSDPKDKYKRIE
jgi:hypothetical protein